MSSSSNLNLLDIRVETSTNLYFLRQLPFYPTSPTPSDILPFSIGFRQIPAPLHLSNTSDNYRGFISPNTISPSTPGTSSSNSSGVTLSPTLPPLEPVDPFEWLFIDSFNNLAIHNTDRTAVRARLESLIELLDNLSRDLIEERDSAIRGIEILTADALRTVRRRLIP